MIEIEGIDYDCSYFDKMKKQEIIELLSRHERENTLVKFLQKVAPDYVVGRKVMSFLLCDHLNLLEE